MKDTDHTVPEKRVAIFQCFWSIQVHTLNLIDLLLEQGWKVDLYLHITGSQVGDISEVAKARNGMVVHELEGTAVLPLFDQKRSMRGIVQRLGWHLSRVLYTRKARVISYALVQKSKSLLREHKYSGIIAVEPMSLIWASRASTRKLPLIYYSLEVYTAKDGRLSREDFKRQEKIEAMAFKKVQGLIIQDPERSDVLLRKYGVYNNPPDTFYLPVSLKPRTCMINQGEDFYLHDMLGISRHKKIILYAGILHPDRFGTDLIDSAVRMSDKFQLVIHTGSPPKTSFEERIHAQAKSKGILLSTIRLPLDEIPCLFDSSYAAIVFYSSATPNNRLTGKASEKAAMAAQTNTPIIAMASTSLHDVIIEYSSGVSISSIQELPEAVRKIEQNYEVYAKGAGRAYEELYNFDSHKLSLIKFVDRIFAPIGES